MSFAKAVVISNMIHKENRGVRLQAMAASLAVHMAVFAAVFHALNAVPDIMAVEKKVMTVSLAAYKPSAGGQPQMRVIQPRPEPVKKVQPKPASKPVKHVRKEHVPQKQAAAKPKKPEPVKSTLPVAEPAPIQKALPETTPEIKAQPTEAAPLSEALASPPSQTVTSAVPADSPPTPDTQKTADPMPGATVLGQIRAMIEQAITYPAVARRLRLEGVVVLSFMLTPDGAVAKAEVQHSSGSSVLDRKALNTLWDLSGDFPSLESITQLTIPITFSLKKS